MRYRFLLVAALAIAIAPMSVATAQPSAYGRHQETVEDLRVKVVGGFVAIQRSWRGELSRWEFFPNLQGLGLKGEDADGLPTKISRGVFTYERATGSTVPLWRQAGTGNRITYVADVFRWENEEGDWIEYDSDGQPQRFGDRNVRIATIERDAEGRVEVLKDYYDQTVLTVEYDPETEELVRAFDYSGRQVLYGWTGGKLQEVTDVRGFTWQYGYAEGRLVTKTDPKGRVTTITYAVDGTVTSIRDQDGFGTEYRYTYDSTKKLFYAREEGSGSVVTETWMNSDREVVRRDFNGRTVQTRRRDRESRVETDENGYETRTVRDALGRVVGEVFPDGSSTRRKLGAFGAPVSIINENGVETRFVNDERGNPVQMIEAYGRPEQRTTLRTFNALGQLTQVRQVVGDVDEGEGDDRVTTFEYDAFDNVERTVDAEGNVTEREHDVLGNVTKLTDGRGEDWLSEYDAAGNLIRTENPLEHDTEREYDGVGNLIRFVDETEAQTLYGYDRQGRLTQLTDALEGVWRYEYTAAGLLEREIDPEGQTVTYGYDRDGRLTGVIDGNGNVTSVSYLAAQTVSGVLQKGRVERTVFPTFTRELEYDSRNRLVASRDIDGESVAAVTRFAYDEAGNLTRTTNPDGLYTELTYDALNRLTKRRLRDGREIEIGRTSWDQTVVVEDPRGNSTTLSFDKLGRRISEKRPSTKETRFEYDPVGNVTAIIDPRNMWVESVYDAAGRREQEKMWPSLTAEEPSRVVTYTYNARDQMTGWDDGTTSGTFTTDALGRSVGQSVNYGSFTKNSSNTYYKNGLTKSYTGPDEISYTYTYDGAGQLRTVDIPGEGKIVYQSYRWTVPTRVVLPGNTVQEYEYDDLLRVTRVHSKDPAGGTVMDQRYTRDLNGRVVRRDTEQGFFEYGYDPAYRLTSMVSDVMPNEAYEYDAAGNRLPADPEVRAHWVYNQDNELLSTDIATYTYDEAGNMVSETTGAGERRFYWDERGRLKLIESGDESAIGIYEYDPFARRIWKEVNGSRVNFYYDRSGLVAEVAESGVVQRSYQFAPQSTWTTAPLAAHSATDHQYYHNDQIGTPQVLTTSSGAVSWRASYSAFGRAQISADVGGNPLRLPGQYWDEESELAYNWYRYYAPSLGRYTTPDPLGFAGGDGNGYAYVASDPVNLVDPRGLYHYVYANYIGPVSRCRNAKSVMAALQRNPNKFFPFRVIDRAAFNDVSTWKCLSLQRSISPEWPGQGSLTDGTTYDLIGPRFRYDGCWDGNGVTVTLDDTSFTFTTDATHFDGAGGTIKFETVERDGSVYLEHTADAPNADWITNFFVKNGEAKAAWEEMARRLRAYFNRKCCEQAR